MLDNQGPLTLSVIVLFKLQNLVFLRVNVQAQSIPAVPTTLMDLLFASCESEDSECCRTVLDLMAAHNLKVDQGSILLALNLAARTGNVTLADQVGGFCSDCLVVLFVILCLSPFEVPASTPDTACHFTGVDHVDLLCGPTQTNVPPSQNPCCFFRRSLLSGICTSESFGEPVAYRRG